jgi:hypothetical protein
MSPPPRPRTRAKPPRWIRLDLAPFEGNPGILTITVGKEAAEYLVWPMASDFGRAFRLDKVMDCDAITYHVLLDPEGSKHSCECKGFLRWNHCKHIEGLLALHQGGRL